MTDDRVFVDANVLVYGADLGQKQDTARSVPLEAD
jgi:hypothetical protein